MYKSVDDFMKHVTSRSPGEDEFHQAVLEVFSSIWDFYKNIHNTFMQEFWIGS